MILGLRTAIYPVTDLDAAKRWYAEMLGQAPYFDQPFYVGFAVGGFELGLLPERRRPAPQGRRRCGAWPTSTPPSRACSRSARPRSSR